MASTAAPSQVASGLSPRSCWSGAWAEGFSWTGCCLPKSDLSSKEDENDHNFESMEELVGEDEALSRPISHRSHWGNSGRSAPLGLRFRVHIMCTRSEANAVTSGGTFSRHISLMRVTCAAMLSEGGRLIRSVNAAEVRSV